MVNRIHNIVLKYPFPFYLAFFLLLFLQFPLHDSLPGKVDTWFFVTAFETIGNHLEAWFSGAEIGNALYPESGVYPFGNYSPAYALAYLPFRAIGVSPLWAYYIFHSLLFASNAFGIFLLGKILLKDRGYALLAGFLFASCNFAFGSMDNPDALGFFPACVSIYFFLKFIWEGKSIYFFYTVLAGGLEPYFSSYVFLFLCVVLGVIGFGNLKIIFGQKKMRQAFMLYFPLFVALLVPYSLIYIFGDAKADAWNPGSAIESVAQVSLNPEDFFRYLPESLLWPQLQDHLGSHNWLAGTRSAGIGLLMWVLGIFGWMKWKKMRLAFGVLFGIGLLLALGPGIKIGSVSIPMPMYLLYKFAHIHDFFRISIRAWFICIAVLSLSSAYGLRVLVKKIRKPELLLGFAFILFAVENIPFSFHFPQNGHFLELPQAEQRRFGNDQVGNIVELPSGFYTGFHPDFPAKCEGENLFEHEVVREYVYMYWQTQHKQNSLNGFTGFIPQSRIENQKLILALPEGNNLKVLLENNDLSEVVFHKDLQLNCEDGGELDFLRNSDELLLLDEDNQVVIFRVKKQI